MIESQLKFSDDKQLSKRIEKSRLIKTNDELFRFVARYLSIGSSPYFFKKIFFLVTVFSDQFFHQNHGTKLVILRKQIKRFFSALSATPAKSAGQVREKKDSRRGAEYAENKKNYLLFSRKYFIVSSNPFSRSYLGVKFNLSIVSRTDATLCLTSPALSF